MDWRSECTIASQRSRTFIPIPHADASSILAVIRVGLWVSGGLRSNDGGSGWSDVMRVHTVVAAFAAALGVKDARAVMMVLAVGVVTLAL